MQGGGQPMYGYGGMVPQYAQFPQANGYPNGQFYGGLSNQVRQPVMSHGAVVRSTTMPSTSTQSSQSKVSHGVVAQATRRAKTPTPTAQPLAVQTAPQLSGQQAASAGPSRAGRPASTSKLGQHNTQTTGYTQGTSSPPVAAPLTASTLAPTQQTQATPVAVQRRSSAGGRTRWPLELWVIRHGETIENHTRTIAGQNASGLTERGQEQARLLSQRLQDVKFSGIYISDLNRTKQTADAVLKAMGPGTPAFTDSRLREKAAGKYEGNKIGYIEQMTRLSGQSHRAFRPPGGESWEDVALRSRSFMREVLHRYCTSSDQHGRPTSNRGYDSTGRSTPVGINYNAGSADAQGEPKRVLIITHGGFISEFLSSAVGGVPNCAKNCSIFVLGCARDQPQSRAQFFLMTVNDVVHLEPLLAKGVELPGPETVTETDADQKEIEDEEDEGKPQDDMQSSSSTVHTATPDPQSVESSSSLSVGASPAMDSPRRSGSGPKTPPLATVVHDVPMAELSARGEQANSVPTAIRMLDLQLDATGLQGSEAHNGQAASVATGSATVRNPVGGGPSIHMRNATMASPSHRRDGLQAPSKLTKDTLGSSPSMEHVHC